MQEYIYDKKKKKMGSVRHLIVTPEQLFEDPASGHIPAFGQCLLTQNVFQKHVSAIFVDECHFIHMAGLAHNGVAAFRPSWGRLDEIKARLPSMIHWHALTATLPNHMLKTVETKILSPSYELTKATSNRRNIIYALHEVTGSLQEMRNYSCFLSKPYSHL